MALSRAREESRLAALPETPGGLAALRPFRDGNSRSGRSGHRRSCHGRGGNDVSGAEKLALLHEVRHTEYMIATEVELFSTPDGRAFKRRRGSKSDWESLGLEHIAGGLTRESSEWYNGRLAHAGRALGANVIEAAKIADLLGDAWNSISARDESLRAIWAALRGGEAAALVTAAKEMLGEECHERTHLADLQRAMVRVFVWLREAEDGIRKLAIISAKLVAFSLSGLEILAAMGCRASWAHELRHAGGEAMEDFRNDPTDERLVSAIVENYLYAGRQTQATESHVESGFQTRRKRSLSNVLPLRGFGKRQWGPNMQHQDPKRVRHENSLIATEVRPFPGDSGEAFFKRRGSLGDAQSLRTERIAGLLFGETSQWFNGCFAFAASGLGRNIVQAAKALDRLGDVAWSVGGRRIGLHSIAASFTGSEGEAILRAAQLLSSSSNASQFCAEELRSAIFEIFAFLKANERTMQRLACANAKLLAFSLGGLECLAVLSSRERWGGQLCEQLGAHCPAVKAFAQQPHCDARMIHAIAACYDHALRENACIWTTDMQMPASVSFYEIALSGRHFPLSRTGRDACALDKAISEWGIQSAIEAEQTIQRFRS